MKPPVFDNLKQGLKSLVEKVSKTSFTEKDLEPLIWDIQIQLISNDVSVKVAEKLCDEIKIRLIGQKTHRFSEKSEVVKNIPCSNSPDIAPRNLSISGRPIFPCHLLH